MEEEYLDSITHHGKTGKISIITDDDHPLFRQPISNVLHKQPDFQVVAEAVVQAVRGVVAGEMILSPPIGEILLKQAARHPAKSVPLQA